MEVSKSGWLTDTSWGHSTGTDSERCGSPLWSTTSVNMSQCSWVLSHASLRQRSSRLLLLLRLRVINHKLSTHCFLCTTYQLRSIFVSFSDYACLFCSLCLALSSDLAFLRETLSRRILATCLSSVSIMKPRLVSCE